MEITPEVAMPGLTDGLSIRQSLVLPTIALIYPQGASLPIGHRKTMYTTQFHSTKCPDWPLYKDPSTTLLSSSKDLLGPNATAKHLFFRLHSSLL